MRTVMVHSSGVRTPIPVSDVLAIERSLHAVYARERIEELVRGVLEDALSPTRLEEPPWHDDTTFEAELARAVIDISDVAADLVAEHLALLLETVPPRLAARLAAAPRFMEQV